MDENAGRINRATDLRIGDQALNNWMRQSLFVDNTPGLYPHGMASPYFFFPRNLIISSAIFFWIQMV